MQTIWDLVLSEQNKLNQANKIVTSHKEIKKKTNKDDVLALVKHIVGKTKLGIQSTKESLMVGRTSTYRCLGCDRAFPQGIHAKRARPVNHKALMPSSGLLTRERKECIAFPRGRSGTLRPLYVANHTKKARKSNAVRYLGRRSPNQTQRFAQQNSYYRPKKHSF